MLTDLDELNTAIWVVQDEWENPESGASEVTNIRPTYQDFT